MPPIVQQQSSRGGLITGLVIAIVFAVGFLVWAIMANAQASVLEQANKAQQGKYSKVISDSAVGNISELTAAFNPDPDKPSRGPTVIDAATEQRNAFVKLITGDREGTEKRALDSVSAATTALKNNPALKGTTFPPDASLTQIISILSTKATADAAAMDKLQSDLKAANENLAKDMETHKAEIAKRDQAVEGSQATATKSLADCKTALDEKQKQVDDFAKQVEIANKALTDFQAQTGVQIQTLQRDLDKARRDYDALLGKYAMFRPNVKESMIRNVDATITQVSPDNICYINLGYGDHVSPGLTFEVYDKFEGVPKMNDGTSALDMPKGKAAIEIINVGQNSSQCRILNARVGVTVAQGDLCVNLVYDRNIKPVFFIYGKFDMDQNGVATDQEAEIVKNLIVRWGGRIADKINIDTDFVLLGKEPSVPLYSPEELQQPIPKQRFDEAQAALKAYNDVRDQGVIMHIPIMNQNRFLYYTGYFESSKR